MLSIRNIIKLTNSIGIDCKIKYSPNIIRPNSIIMLKHNLVENLKNPGLEIVLELKVVDKQIMMSKHISINY